MVIELKTECKNIIFASSSGHCTLDCDYCIVDPIAKHESSLEMSDIDFILKQLYGNTFIGFSGKGDFFAGYKKSDKLLSRILERDVEIALDINGVLIHEFTDIDKYQLDKIEGINLTMHYKALRDSKMLERWADNALAIIQRKCYDLFIGTVLSPLLVDSWAESLDFYEKKIFSRTGWKVVLVPDISRNMSPWENDQVSALLNQFSHMIHHLHNEDFASPFQNVKSVLCPAGKSFFRVWNNGMIDGCSNIDSLKQLGNAKERIITLNGSFFPCSDPSYCECHAIFEMGKMQFGQHLSAQGND